MNVHQQKSFGGRMTPVGTMAVSFILTNTYLYSLISIVRFLQSIHFRPVLRLGGHEEQIGFLVQ
jgi:hypothetical protein